MNKLVKRCLIAATTLVVLGMILFASAMTVKRWDISQLSTVQFQTKSYAIEESFQDLRIHTETAELFLAPSDDGTCKVVCHEPDTETHTVAVENGILTVRAERAGKWYDHIGISTELPTVTVYLPQKEYGALAVRASTGSIQVPADFRFQRVDIAADAGDVEWLASVAGQLKIEMDTGDVRMEHVTVDTLDLASDTGEVEVASVTCAGEARIKVGTGSARLAQIDCGSFTGVGDTGDLLMEQVKAAGAMTIQNDTGAVQFDGCDAAELSILTDTGDVMGTLLSEKVFLAESDTGDIQVPKTVTGGKCEIRTDTGDIKIELA